MENKGEKMNQSEKIVNLKTTTKRKKKNTRKTRTKTTAKISSQNMQKLYENLKH